MNFEECNVNVCCYNFLCVLRTNVDTVRNVSSVIS